MISDITQTTIWAFQSATLLSEMALPNMEKPAYDSLRVELLSVIGKIRGFEDFALPAELQDFLNHEDEILDNVMERLSLLRSRVNGEVLPLTFFILTFCVCRGVIFVAFDDTEQWQPYRGMLRLCLKEFGLDADAEIALLESEARLLLVPGKDGFPILRNADRIDGSTEYLTRVFEKIYYRLSSPTELAAQMARLVDAVEEFRKESHAEHAQILESIESLHHELVNQLVDAGIEPEEAKRVADIESEGFLNRLRRWSTSAKARDAVEAALWAALDFVPAGTGVKLGIKVLSAVRKSLKG